MESRVEQLQEALAVLLVARWEHVCRKIEQLAQEFSEEDYEWRPQPDVRSCGEVVRHVAFWNRYVCDCLKGTEPDSSSNELPAGEYPAKAQMVQALRQTAENVAAALRERANRQDLETAELILPFLEHTSEHYGQLASYARLRGIVPPASRA
jgi:uncharacterized damage-inducible protein DinB